jgi:hypothetical protein
VRSDPRCRHDADLIDLCRHPEGRSFRHVARYEGFGDPPSAGTTEANDTPVDGIGARREPRWE